MAWRRRHEIWKCNVRFSRPTGKMWWTFEGVAVVPRSHGPVLFLKCILLEQGALFFEISFQKDEAEKHCSEFWRLLCPELGVWSLPLSPSSKMAKTMSYQRIWHNQRTLDEPAEKQISPKMRWWFPNQTSALQILREIAFERSKFEITEPNWREESPSASNKNQK